MRRVSYHQSVFDLLDVPPAESARAREMIENHEPERGVRLPESVRQWYLIDDVVALREDEGEEGRLWYDYSNMDHPEPLEAVLRQFAGATEAGAPAGTVRVLVENQAVCSWFLRPDGGDDPPVVVDEDLDDDPDAPGRMRVRRWVQVAGRFSEFVFAWVAGFYYRDWTPLSERSRYAGSGTRPRREKPHLNGLWLYAPAAEPLAPPLLDYLIENLSEDFRREVAPGVMQYRFQGERGRLRVTTDEYGVEGGVSAWWLHGESADDLFHLARRVWWWKGMPEALQGRTREARPVVARLRES